MLIQCYQLPRDATNDHPGSCLEHNPAVEGKRNYTTCYVVRLLEPTKDFQEKLLCSRGLNIQHERRLCPRGHLSSLYQTLHLMYPTLTGI